MTTNNELMSLDTLLYPGFGQFQVFKDSNCVITCCTKDQIEEYGDWRLRDVEHLVEEKPLHRWTVKVDGPMSDFTLWRNESDEWEVIQKGHGFA